MRLISYDARGTWRAGVVFDSIIFDVGRLADATSSNSGDSRPTVRDLLTRHGSSLASLASDLERAAEKSTAAQVGDIRTTRLGPPVPDPVKVLCIGTNYGAHAAETGRELPTHPNVFSKFASTLIGPRDDIAVSQVSDQLDFEGELAVVIGRECRGVAEDEAMEAVAGLMVLNDVTARDLQYHSSQFLPGKCVDGSTPCGPALVTLDTAGDPHALKLSTRVNGTEVQNARTDDMIFRIPQIIAYISHFLRLSPGDIIATGTPEGIGSKRTPPLWLTPGDRVEVEIESLGLISNAVR